MRTATRYLPVLLAFLVAACGRVPPNLDLDQPETCVLVPGSADPGETLEIALLETVRAVDAPVPATASEKLVFRHLYETLVDLDCEGGVRPGLAGSWKSEQGGRVWRFTLRENARFWDGRRLTGPEVGSAWARGFARSGPGLAGVWGLVHPDSLRSMGADVFWVALTEPVRDVRFFAHPALAVAKAGKRGGWPVGSGPYAVKVQYAPARETGVPLAQQILEVEPNQYAPRGGRGLNSIRFRVYPDHDPRDLLAHGVQAIMIRELTAVEFASGLGYTAIPLSWDRVYALAVPGFLDGEDALDSGALGELREELAEEVMSADAVPAHAGQVPVSPRSPLLQSPTFPGSVSPPRIVCAVDDADAVSLAGRLVVVAGRPEPPSDNPEPFLERSVPLPEVLVHGQRPVVEALASPDLESRLRAGADAAFIVAFTSLSPQPERDEARLAARMPWLPERGSLIPLVITRSWLVLQTDLRDVIVGGDGFPRFEAAGWAGFPEEAP